MRSFGILCGVEWYLDYLTLEGGTDKLSRNVGMELPFYDTHQPPWHSSISFSVSDNCPQYCNARSCEWWNGVLSPFRALFLPLLLPSSFPLLFSLSFSYLLNVFAFNSSLASIPPNLLFSIFPCCPSLPPPIVLRVLHSFFFQPCFLHFHIANSKLTSLCHGRACGAIKVARLKRTIFQERRFSASEWRTIISSGSFSS